MVRQVDAYSRSSVSSWALGGVAARPIFISITRMALAIRFRLLYKMTVYVFRRPCGRVHHGPWTDGAAIRNSGLYSRIGKELRHASDPCRNLDYLRLSFAQRGRGAPPRAGAQGRHRNFQRHRTRDSPGRADFRRDAVDQRAAADRTGRRRQPHPRRTERGTKSAGRSRHVQACGGLPAQGQGPVNEGYRHPRRRPACGAFATGGAQWPDCGGAT